MSKLIDCATCGYQVSTSAEVCPNCGDTYPDREYVEKRATKVTSIILFSVMLLAIIYYATKPPL